LLGFEAAAEKVVYPQRLYFSFFEERELRERDPLVQLGDLEDQMNLKFRARERHWIALFYNQADRLVLAHLLSHHDKIKHKLGSIPLQILQLDVLKY
jgi:hypothetical protein